MAKTHQLLLCSFLVLTGQRTIILPVFEKWFLCFCPYALKNGLRFHSMFCVQGVHWIGLFFFWKTTKLPWFLPLRFLLYSCYLFSAIFAFRLMDCAGGTNKSFFILPTWNAQFVERPIWKKHPKNQLMSEKIPRIKNLLAAAWSEFDQVGSDSAEHIVKFQRWYDKTFSYNMQKKRLNLFAVLLVLSAEVIYKVEKKRCVQFICFVLSQYAVDFSRRSILPVKIFRYTLILGNF